MSPRPTCLDEGYRRCGRLTARVRHDLLLGCGAAAAAAAPRRVRRLRALPAGRRHRRRHRTGPTRVDGADRPTRLAAFADGFRAAPRRRVGSDDPVHGGGRRHRPTAADRPGVLRPVLRRDGAGPDDHRASETWADLRDGYMEGSAAVIGEMMLPVLEPLTAAGHGTGPRARPGLPAHELPPRRRRGPRPRPRVPARRRPRPARFADPWIARRDAGVARVHGRADRPQPRAVPSWRTPGIAMLPPPRPGASAPRASSTPGSSTGSRTPTTTCSATGSACRPGARPLTAGAHRDHRPQPRGKVRAPMADRELSPPGDRPRGSPSAGSRNRHRNASDRPGSWPDPRGSAASSTVALSRNPGGWFVVGASARRPGRLLGGRARSTAGKSCSGAAADGPLVAGPGACPHMGALLVRLPGRGVGACSAGGTGMALPGGRIRTCGRRGRPATTGSCCGSRLPVDGEVADRPAGASPPAAARGVDRRRDQRAGRSANPATSWPTGSIPGTVPGSTRTRSAI